MKRQDPIDRLDRRVGVCNLGDTSSEFQNFRRHSLKNTKFKILQIRGRIFVFRTVYGVRASQIGSLRVFLAAGTFRHSTVCIYKLYAVYGVIAYSLI